MNEPRRLKRVLTRTLLSLPTLAGMAGVSLPAVKRWSAGVGLPEGANALRLAEGLERHARRLLRLAALLRAWAGRMPAPGRRRSPRRKERRT
jgi:predicted transcriptional regulator